MRLLVILKEGKSMVSIQRTICGSLFAKLHIGPPGRY